MKTYSPRCNPVCYNFNLKLMVEHDEGEWVKKSEIPGWISAEERLPELFNGYSKDVAVRNKYGNWYRSRWDSYAKYWEERDVGCHSDEVTHWMPLPELPVMEDDQ